MCADIYTKAFSDSGKWEAACELINIVDPSKLTKLLTDQTTQQTEAAVEQQQQQSPSSQCGGVPSRSAKPCSRFNRPSMDLDKPAPPNNKGFHAIFVGAPGPETRIRRVKDGLYNVPVPHINRLDEKTRWLMW